VNFGIQVVGRIMRVHRLLQGRAAELPAELSYGYVFLANTEAQEGLLGAASAINKMPEHLASANTSTVVTIVAGEPLVQVAKPGEPLKLFPTGQETSEPATPPPVPASTKKATPVSPTSFAVPFTGQSSLFSGLSSTPTPATVEQINASGGTALTKVFTLEAQVAPKKYPRKLAVPAELVTESLPETPDDFEDRLVTFIDFKPALGDRLKVRSKVVERRTDIFEVGTVEDKDIWARVSPTAIAEKARQLAFEFEDVDRRELLKKLKERFREALLAEGHDVPESEEELTRQLELVLVRNPSLVKTAYKRIQAEQVKINKVHLRDTLESEWDLEPAAKNAYGVFPEDLSPSEREFAELLDTSDEVVWWHRNPVKKTDSVALYGWNKGVGFFPDFVVAIDGRKEGQGVALTELKGAQLLYYDREKAAAKHPVYGRVFMVGKEGATSDLRLWRLTSDELVDDGPFEAKRLRYS
jgi:hypothetical protein